MFPRIARLLLLAIGGLCLAAGVVGLMAGAPTFVPLLFGTVLLVGGAVERWRYKRIEPAAPSGFQPTAERFVDPTSRELVRVYADPSTGERRYVRDVARP